MMFPNFHYNKEGNAIIETTHLSENKKESKKEVFNRTTYTNWIEVNPITKQVISFECDCPSFLFSEGSCKHLKQSIKLLKDFGINLV